MFTLDSILTGRRIDYEKALEWHTKGAEAGLPKAMFSLACHLDKVGRCRLNR